MPSPSIVEICRQKLHAAVSTFYGEFSEMVNQKPRSRAELDPYYVMIDFAGQAPLANFYLHIANAPGFISLTYYVLF
jgi:hypothetical protein